MKYTIEYYLGITIGFGFKRRDNGILYFNIIIPFVYLEISIPPKGFKIV